MEKVTFICPKCRIFFKVDKDKCNYSVMLCDIFTRCPRCDSVVKRGIK